MRAIVLTVFSLSMLHPALAERKPIIQVHEFHVSETGGFLIKTIKEMGTPEFETIMTAACAVAEFDCSEEAENIRVWSERIATEGVSRGQRYRISGRIFRHKGEEWDVFYDAPKGYEICNAWLDKLSVSTHSTFEGTIERKDRGHGLRIYAHVPKNRVDGHN